MGGKKKKLKGLYPFNKEDSKLFQDVAFVVVCSHTEKHFLWMTEFDRPDPRLKEEHRIRSWEDAFSGHGVQIGELGGMPICLTVWSARIDGKKVAFVDVHSQVVDHRMVDAWLDHHAGHIRWDSGTRPARTNASNFHHCIAAIRGK